MKFKLSVSENFLLALECVTRLLVLDEQVRLSDGQSLRRLQIPNSPPRHVQLVVNRSELFHEVLFRKASIFGRDCDDSDVAVVEGFGWRARILLAI